MWFRKALRACNRARLAANDEVREIRRVHDATTVLNEELLELKKDAEVQMDALRYEIKNHEPGCKMIIANKNHDISDRDGQIDKLYQYIQDRGKEHKEQILAGANEGAMMLIADQDRVRADLNHDLAEQASMISHLQEKVERNDIYIADEHGRLSCYVDKMEGTKARALAAEKEVVILRKQLDKGDENLADPRKWEHHRACTEMKAEARVVVEEYEQKKDLYAKVIEGLWVSRHP